MNGSTGSNCTVLTLIWKNAVAQVVWKENKAERNPYAEFIRNLPASDQFIVIRDQHPHHRPYSVLSGTLACKGTALFWSSDDSPSGIGMVAKMRVPEPSDSIFMIPSN
jgi:hypothetical protein